MYSNPKKDRTPPGCILIEQFRHKGYQCREIREGNSTIFILTHQQKQTGIVLQAIAGNHKNFLKTN